MIRRAWNGHVTEGQYRDQFANAISHRVSNEIENPPGASVELVSNWVELADTLYTTVGEPMTPEAVEVAAQNADLTPFYEYANDDDE